MSIEDLRRERERLQHVLDLARGVNSSRGLADLLEACFQGLAGALTYDEAGLLLEEGEAFRAFFVARTEDGLLQDEAVFERVDAPMTRSVLEGGKPLRLGDLTDPETVKRYQPRTHVTNPDDPSVMRAFMAVPVRADPVAGVLSVQSATPDVYTESDLEHLATLAELIAVALKRVRWDEHEAILQGLGRIGRHASDSQRFFESLLDCAVTAFKGTAGAVWEAVEGRFTLRGAAGVELLPEAGAEELLRSLLPEDGAASSFRSPTEAAEPLRGALAAAGLETLLAVPLTAPCFEGLVLVAANRRFTQWDLDRAGFMQRELVPHLENLALYRRLAEEAIRDPLTGAFNRRYFMMKADEVITHASRYSHPLAFLVVDLQRFSEVNNTYGHQTGDRVLAIVAATFQRNLRASDTFFRVGGDEFVLLLPQADSEAARRTAERCAAALAAEPELARYGVMANIGWAAYPDDGKELDALLEVGDRRMYTAKAAGEAVFEPMGE